MGRWREGKSRHVSRRRSRCSFILPPVECRVLLPEIMIGQCVQQEWQLPSATLEGGCMLKQTHLIGGQTSTTSSAPKKGADLRQ
jgi:hypothetical protein